MGFNLLDLALLVLLTAAVVGGWRLGFITRALSWAGSAVGLAIAARLIPSVVASGRGTTGRGQLAIIAVGILVGGALLGQAVGRVAGNRLNLAVRSPQAQRVDSAGGALAGALGVVVAVWLLVPVVADVQGWPSRAVRHSRVARAVTTNLPGAPDASGTLRRLLGNSYPQVFDAIRPAPDTGPPPKVTGISQVVAARVVRSTVKVVGQACDRVQQGSGFVVGPDLVLTNAHVVAGERHTILERSDNTTVTASVVAFDPAVDLAVLRAPGIDRPPLTLTEVEPGGRGAVFGHPGGGGLVASPFRVSERVTAIGTDIYDHARTRRDVLILASALRPGDSGSALVDSRGRVVGVAFAIAPDRPAVAYALAVTEVRPVLRTAHRAPVDTGPCVG